MHEIFEAFERAGKEVFLVGGAVRDLARGVPLKDLDDMDYCTNARPKETLRILQENGFTTYDVGIEFGTVGAVLRGPEEDGYPKDCQITTYRSAEFYRRGSRHPEVRFGDTLAQDLCRRDFSINSIAMDGQDNYIDPYDGLGDLKRGILRVVSDPLETLAEDPLRILRVGRFMSKLGFSPSQELQEAATERAGYILDISRERWLMEMNKLVKGPYAVSGLEFLRQVRILGIILPEVAGLHHEEQGYWARTIDMLPRVPATEHHRWSALLHAIGKPFCEDEDKAAELACLMSEGVLKRFKCDNQLLKQVQHLLKNAHLPLSFDNQWSDPQTRRLVKRLDPYAQHIMDMAEAEAQVRHRDAKASLEQLAHLHNRVAQLEAEGTLRAQLPAGIGKAIINTFSLRPSPVIGEIKQHLEEMILDDKLKNKEDTSYYIEHLRKHPPTCLAQASRS